MRWYINAVESRERGGICSGRLVILLRKYCIHLIPLPAVMIIAVNMKPIQPPCPDGFKGFIDEVFRRVAIQNPGQQFIFISDRAFDKEWPAVANVKAVVTGPKTSNRLLQKFWFDVKLPAVLKKYEADIFISADGRCSLATRLPQCLLVPGTRSLHDQGKQAIKVLQKAGRLICFSDQLKEDIARGYKIPGDHISVLPVAAAEIFQPPGFEEKKEIKDRYSDGKEFFIYTGPVSSGNDLLNLLKAFSVFKKRQQSGIKLLLAGEVEKKDKAFTGSLASYKYRDDVVVTGHLPATEKARLLGAAYALVDPGNDGPGIAALEAAGCNVPVIAVTGQPLLHKDSFLLAANSGHTGLAEKMMLLYKDEDLRNRLIEKGREAAGRYSLDKTAGSLWELIAGMAS